MIDRLRSRFSVAGLSLSDGARSATDLLDEFAFRHWNRNPVVDWDPARQVMTVEFELEFAERDNRESLVLVQDRELRDCLQRGATRCRPISIDIIDSWIAEQDSDPLTRAA